MNWIRRIRTRMPGNNLLSAAAQGVRFFANSAASFLAARQKRTDRRLRVCETVGLGEKRFVAVVQFEQQRFLVGTTGSAISLLAKLQDIRDDSNQFAALMTHAAEREWTVQ